MNSVVQLPLRDEERHLPRPVSERFAPLRLGVVNIWQYDYQEWWLEGGNLLLRGDNTVGKTKVIELTLPFLFDAQMHPNRLDPFGQRDGRSMHWNLLEGGAFGQPQREGFAWLEFGRTHPNGESRFVTIGAWLRATSASPRVDAAFFVTDKRVREQLFLPRAGEPMIGKEGLRRQVGEVFETRRDYQLAVDQALFGLGLERYREMVDLLLQLRQPKLSAALKPSRLIGIIAASLPPLDEDAIAGLAAQYEQLEQYQARIEELESNEKGVDRYLRTYRTLVRRQVRLAADDLRGANTTVEDEARRLDTLQQTLETARRERHTLEVAQARAREEKHALEGRLDAARQAPEMRTADRIEQARNEARQAEATLREAEEDLERASRDADAAGGELADAEGQLRPVRSQLSKAQHDADQAATPADVAVLHRQAVTAVVEDPDGTTTQLKMLAAAKRSQVNELQALLDRTVPVEASLGTVREQLSEAEAALETAVEVSAAAVAAADQAGADRVQAIHSWFAALRELPLEPEERHELLERALDLELEPAAVLAMPHRRASQALDEAAAPLHGTLERLQTRIRDLDAEVEQLARQREIAPMAPAVRTADRSQRQGAPFYRCVEFAESLGGDEAARLEAGLEASGILDAWVSPDGHVESELFDTTILSSDPVVRSLAASLVAVDGAVAAPVIMRILRSLGVDDGAESFVATDGRWRLGTLQGRAHKPAAEFVGAAAREHARQRRLAELHEQRGAAAKALGMTHTALTDLRNRRQRLDADTEAFPSASSYRQAHLKAAAANAELAAASVQMRQLRAHEERIAARLRELQSTVSSRAAEVSLTGFLDRLPELLGALRVYEEQVTGLYMAASKCANLTRSAERAQRIAQHREQRRDHEGTKVGRRRREHARAQARAHEMEASIAGHAALDALRRVDLLKAGLAALENAIDERDVRIVAAATEVGEADGRLLELKERHHASSERRAHAAAVLTSLVERGTVDVALGTEIDRSGEWSMTRALLLARQQVEPALEQEPIHTEALNNAQNNLTAAFSDLKSTLHPYAPSLHWQEGVPDTTAIYNQLPVDIRVLRQRLHDEVDSQRRLLSEKEKDIFEHFLMADLANHLRERILRARQQVQEINANLRAHPTTSGMTLSLRLTEDAEDSTEKLALEHLMKDPSLLHDHERELLRQFFQSRIAAARVQAGNQTWREHLTEALDYRRWHRMTIHQQVDGHSTAFTDARYAAGSGGEKSVSIHQPLFAAAATYYNSASTRVAPRLIVLDEAFAGIDFPTRGRCLEMAAQFDLDLVMTSYEEMGTHAELPALAIYQMVRDPARRGVYCERWTWNGHELQQAAGS